MKRKALLAVSLFLAFGLIGMVGSSAVQQSGPVYSLEGAWYSVAGPGLDTFVSNAERPGVEGTFLCTAGAVPKNPNPSHPGDPNYWLSVIPSGHGNWVRIDKNRYAFTAMRPVMDQDGNQFAWARFWGTITLISENEYTGTVNYRWYDFNGMPYPRTGTMPLHSYRIEIMYE